MEAISSKDRNILRELAKKQQELANTPKMAELRTDWELHGAYTTSSRPMVVIQAGGFANEILSPLMECETEQARVIEREMRLHTSPSVMFNDDSIIYDYMPVYTHRRFTAFGIEPKIKRADSDKGSKGLGYQYIAVIQDLEKDFNILGKSVYAIDRESTKKDIELKNDLLGDILPVRLSGIFVHSSLTQHIVHIMGMENMFTSMMDYPDLFNKMMSMLTDDYIAFYGLLDSENVLLPTVDECPLPQGSYSYNSELPRGGGGHIKTTDIWGYMDSQETSGVSPEMFMEYIAPHYKRIINRFGLLSYGCCEAVNPIWDCFLSGLANLRKVSISSWADEEYMGERMRHKKMVYMRKPSPNLLSVAPELDEDAVTGHINKTISAARGCHLEIIQRDVYRIHHNIKKVKRYVELIKKCCEKHKL